MYKAVIVDDENRSVETLKSIIQQFCSDEVEVTGTANSVQEAYPLILGNLTRHCILRCRNASW